MALAQQRFLNRKERIHQLDDADLDSQVFAVAGDRGSRAEQAQEFSEAALERPRDSLHSAKVQFFEVLQDLVDQANGPSQQLIRGPLGTVAPLGISNFGVRLREQPHQPAPFPFLSGTQTRRGSILDMLQNFADRHVYSRRSRRSCGGGQGH